MPSTYTPIATTTLGSAASSVTFSSISGAYTDLVLVIRGKMSVDGGTTLYLNNDTGANYSYTTIYGDGSSAVSNRGSGAFSFYADTTDSTAICHIMNYANTTTYKTVLGRSNTSNYVLGRVTLWRSTSAISSLVVSNNNSNTYLTGTTFTLYGIKAA